jgi:hypothetical protein
MILVAADLELIPVEDETPTFEMTEDDGCTTEEGFDEIADKLLETIVLLDPLELTPDADGRTALEMTDEYGCRMEEDLDEITDTVEDTGEPRDEGDDRITAEEGILDTVEEILLGVTCGAEEMECALLPILEIFDADELAALLEGIEGTDDGVEADAE